MEAVARCHRCVSCSPRPLPSALSKRCLMNTQLALAAILLCIAAPVSALAQGVRLSWNGCALGQSDNAFACASNTPLHYLVSTFVAPQGITSFIGATTEVLVSSTAPLPAWWAFQAGGCRARSPP